MADEMTYGDVLQALAEEHGFTAAIVEGDLIEVRKGPHVLHLREPPMHPAKIIKMIREWLDAMPRG